MKNVRFLSILLASCLIIESGQAAVFLPPRHSIFPSSPLFAEQAFAMALASPLNPFHPADKFFWRRHLPALTLGAAGLGILASMHAPAVLTLMSGAILPFPHGKEQKIQIGLGWKKFGSPRGRKLRTILTALYGDLTPLGNPDRLKDLSAHRGSIAAYLVDGLDWIEAWENDQSDKSRAAPLLQEPLSEWIASQVRDYTSKQLQLPDWETEKIHENSLGALHAAIWKAATEGNASEPNRHVFALLKLNPRQIVYNVVDEGVFEDGDRLGTYRFVQFETYGFRWRTFPFYHEKKRIGTRTELTMKWSSHRLIPLLLTAVGLGLLAAHGGFWAGSAHLLAAAPLFLGMTAENLVRRFEKSVGEGSLRASRERLIRLLEKTEKQGRRKERMLKAWARRVVSWAAADYLFREFWNGRAPFAIELASLQLFLDKAFERGEDRVRAVYLGFEGDKRLSRLFLGTLCKEGQWEVIHNLLYPYFFHLESSVTIQAKPVVASHPEFSLSYQAAIFQLYEHLFPFVAQKKWMFLALPPAKDPEIFPFEPAAWCSLWGKVILQAAAADLLWPQRRWDWTASAFDRHINKLIGKKSLARLFRTLEPARAINGSALKPELASSLLEAIIAAIYMSHGGFGNGLRTVKEFIDQTNGGSEPNDFLPLFKRIFGSRTSPIGSPAPQPHALRAAG